MNKTALCIVGIILATFVIVSYWYIDYLKSIGYVKMDRFTVCVQTVMNEARLSNKPVDVEKAKDICVHVRDNEMRK